MTTIRIYRCVAGAAVAVASLGVAGPACADSTDPASPSWTVTQPTRAPTSPAWTVTRPVTPSTPAVSPTTPSPLPADGWPDSDYQRQATARRAAQRAAHTARQGIAKAATTARRAAAAVQRKTSHTVPVPVAQRAAPRPAPVVDHVVVHHRNGVRHVTIGGRTWQVRRGQTLTFIARQEGVTVTDIVATNGSIVNRNVIYTGQTLRIPR